METTTSPALGDRGKAMSDEGDFLTVTEVAALLKVERRTVLRHIAAGDIPATKLFDRLWRIPAAALQDVLRTDTGSLDVSAIERRALGDA